MRAHGVCRRALAHSIGADRETREHVAMLVEARL
jgi:hypothetical protein